MESFFDEYLQYAQKHTDDLRDVWNKLRIFSSTENRLPIVIDIALDYSNSPDLQKRIFSNYVFWFIFSTIENDVVCREKKVTIENQLKNNIENNELYLNDINKNAIYDVKKNKMLYVNGTAMLLGAYYANVPKDRFYYPFFDFMRSLNNKNIAYFFLLSYSGRKSLSENTQNKISELWDSLQTKTRSD